MPRGKHAQKRKPIPKRRQKWGRFIAAFLAVVFMFIFFSPFGELAWEQEDLSVYGDAHLGEAGPPMEAEEQSIIISALGDCALGAEYAQQGTSFHSVFAENNGDYGYFFSGVRSVLAQDDLTVANLETSLTKAAERIDKSHFKYAYWIKGEPDYARILAAGSVEAVSVANNHIFDYCIEGFRETQGSLVAAGVDFFGFERVLIKEIKGVKIGLLGFSEINVGGRWQTYTELKKEVASQIEALADTTELIIVSFHWGNEKEIRPSATQIELARMAIDTGADLVLGHHPHVLQGIEDYKGKKIVYSLGNFCFGANRNPYDRDTMIYQLTFTFREGILAETKERIIPCLMTTAEKGNDYRPRLLEGDDALRVLQKVQSRTNLLREKD